MINARRIITISGTLFCALSAGFLMQHVLLPAEVEQRSQGVQVASVAAVDALPVTDMQPIAEQPYQIPTLDDAVDIAIEDVLLTAFVPIPPSAAPQPDLLPDTPVMLVALDDEPISVLPREEAAPSFACELKVAALSAPAAMVTLLVEAPCLAEQRFTVHHNGMMVAGVADDAGLASLDLPALSENAVYIVTFDGGESAVAKAEVSAIEYYDRAIVQWTGPDGLQVHALEYGAGYDEDGHVWAGAMGDISTAAKGEGGFITRLGEDDLLSPYTIEVYTFPTGTAINRGSVHLSLEAEVTEANCGRDIEAQVLQKSGVEPMRAKELTLAMPECDAVGDFLVLKNMFDDLSIARN